MLQNLLFLQLKNNISNKLQCDWNKRFCI